MNAANEIIDGSLFKSPPSRFETKVEPVLSTFGGAVGYWDNLQLNLPKTSHHAPFKRLIVHGIAVSDEFPVRAPYRYVYLEYYNPHFRTDLWFTTASSNMTKVCE